MKIICRRSNAQIICCRQFWRPKRAARISTPVSDTSDTSIAPNLNAFGGPCASAICFDMAISAKWRLRQKARFASRRHRVPMFIWRRFANVNMSVAILLSSSRAGLTRFHLLPSDVAPASSSAAANDACVMIAAIDHFAEYPWRRHA